MGGRRALERPQTGHHLMDLPVDPEDLTRVEVFRGGASSALGTGAMTGAVALTAGPSTQDGTLIVAESGSNAWMRAKVTGDFGSDLKTATGSRGAAPHFGEPHRHQRHLGLKTRTRPFCAPVTPAGWPAIGGRCARAWGTPARRLAPSTSTPRLSLTNTRRPKPCKAKRCTPRRWTT